MGKAWRIILFISVISGPMNLQSQNLNHAILDTLRLGQPNEQLTFTVKFQNNTSQPVAIKINRIKNVMPDAPQWISQYEMGGVCYVSSLDSAIHSILSGDTADFYLRFFTIDSALVGDSATAIIRWTNLNNPANTFIQPFTGITKIGSGTGDLNQNLASIKINPNPIRPGDVFMVNISNVKENKPMRMVFYNLFGSEVASTLPMIEGFNLVSLDLPAGVYSYALVSDDAVMNTGKISLVQ